jgi:hypothetical protein
MRTTLDGTFRDLNWSTGMLAGRKRAFLLLCHSLCAQSWRVLLPGELCSTTVAAILVALLPPKNALPAAQLFFTDSTVCSILSAYRTASPCSTMPCAYSLSHSRRLAAAAASFVQTACL